MTEPALPSRYRLSMSIAHQDGVRTYIAYDHALSRPVLAHLLDTAGPFTPQTMEALLATLPAQDAANIVETAMTERGWAVITLPTDGLNHFVAWLNQRVAAPRTPAPLPPPAPAAPMPPIALPAAPAGEFTQMFSPGARAATPSVAPRSDVPPVAAQAPYAPMPVLPPPPSTPVWTTPPTIPSAPQRLSDVTLGSSTPEVHTNPAALPPLTPPARPAPAAPAAGEFTQMFSPGAVRPAMPSEPRHPATSPPLPSASAPLPLPLPDTPVAPPPVPAYGSIATPPTPAPVPPPMSQPPMAFPPPASPGAYPPIPAFAPPPAPPPMSQPNSGFGGQGVSSLPPLPPMAAPPSPPFTPPAPVYSPPPAFTPPPAPALSPPPFAVHSNQPPTSVPPVLPPPLFDLPEAGAAPKRARAAAASDYTMIMNAAVPAVAPPSKEGEKPAAIAKSPTRLTLPVILIINAVLLLALLLILYFAFRNPPASVPTIKDAKSSADSTRRAQTDSGSPRDSNAGGGRATTRP